MSFSTRTGLALISCCMVCLVGAAPVPAQGVLDANCPGPSPDYNGIGGSGRMAQTFTAQRTGGLVHAEVGINKQGSPGGDWVMQILATDDAGVPVNTVLASTTPIADASVPTGFSTLPGVFASPASVQAGKTYAISITRPGANSVRVQTFFNNPCAGVQYQSLPGQTTWAPFVSTYDTVFAVFVKPSNAFTLGRTALNSKKGTATLTVNVPYAGELIASGKGVKAAGARAVTSKSVAAGTVKLLIKAKGAKRKTLNETGKVTLKPKITYTPTGGDPGTQSTKVKLKKNL